MDGVELDVISISIICLLCVEFVLFVVEFDIKLFCLSILCDLDSNGSKERLIRLV